MKPTDLEITQLPVPPCPSWWGQRFGHKFEGRYHTSSTLEHDLKSFQDYDGARILEAMKSHKSTYVGDVCVRCGHGLPFPPMLKVNAP